ncbi:hypothetical protein PAMA_015897 [Pampus argenteus]
MCQVMGLVLMKTKPTASDEVTNSTNSDNVFDDDEVTSPLSSSSSDKKDVDRDDWTVAIKPSISAKSTTAKASTSMISKESPSPTNFLFQSCSPGIMGCLSASTLRGKIQKLPLYLSCSQETLNKAGVGAESPAEDKSREEITIKVFSQLMFFMISFVSTLFCGHLRKTELTAVSPAAAVRKSSTRCYCFL